MRKNIVKLVFALSACFLFFTQNIVFGQNINDFEYRNEYEGMTITGYRGSSKAVVIPREINGLPVTKIGYQAFAYDQLTSVSIPESVTQIDSGAFYNNRLTDVILPASLIYIGDVAFSFNRITSVVIPGSVKRIGAEAFSGNRLASVSLPDDVRMQTDSFFLALYDKYAGNGNKKSIFIIAKIISSPFEIVIIDNSVVEIMHYYGNDKDVILPPKINGMPVVAIGDRVFSNSHLTSVVIPTTVHIIGDDAFVHNQLTKVVIPGSVRIIGNGAFIDNQINNLVLLDSLVSIGNAAFAFNNITELVLPDSLVDIGFGAFSSNKLTKVVIPGSVKSLGEQVFDSSVELKQEKYIMSAEEMYNSYYSY